MPDRIVILGAFALGLLAGPALDQIHVVTGTLWYEHPWQLGQAWWVAPQFGAAFALVVAVMLVLDRRLARDAPPSPSLGLVAWQFAAFVLAYAVTGIGHESPGVVFVILALALALRAIASRPDRAMLTGLLLLTASGTLYEATLTSIPGTFDYRQPGLGTVPIWLPLLYAHAGAIAMSGARHARAATAATSR